MILKAVAHALSPGGPAARLSILIFHRVLNAPDPLFPSEPDIRRFAQIVHWVKDWFNVLPLDHAVDLLQRGTLPARALAITFDDGYLDNLTNAVPLLKHHGVPATFFVATSFLDGGRMWNDTVIEAVRRCKRDQLDLRCLGLDVYPLGNVHDQRRVIEALLRQLKYLDPELRQQAVAQVAETVGKALPNDLMMQSHQLRQLRDAGMQVGAHTCGHPILESCPDQQANWEIAHGKQCLESILGEPVKLFAYPNGKPDVDYSARHVAMVRAAGFSAAVSTAPGVARTTDDHFQLPRFTPWDKSRLRYGTRMVLNLRSTRAVVAQPEPTKPIS